MNPDLDDLPAGWAVPLDEPPDAPAPAPTAAPIPPPAEPDEPFLMRFRDADAPPPEGFVPKLLGFDKAA